MNPTRITSLSLLVGVTVLFAFPQTLNGAPSTIADRLAEPHILYGVQTDIREAPFVARLYRFGKVTCGAAIVSKSSVVTTAKCTENVPTKQLQIGVGSSKIDGTNGWLHSSKYLARHFHYNPTTLDYDIAVVKVRIDFFVTDTVQPIPLPYPGEPFLQYSLSATVYGFGATLNAPEGVTWSQDLTSTDIILNSREKCQEMYRGMNASMSIRMLCGGAEIGAEATYMGDNGSPLVQQGKLIGLASWTLKPANPKFSSVFINVMSVGVREFIGVETDV